MSESPEPQLDPEIFRMAVTEGMIDDHLDNLAHVIRLRKEYLAANRAAALVSGQYFYLRNIVPKNMSGEQVEFVRRDGMWLVCKVSSTGTTRFPRGATIRLRESHVGTIVY